LLFIYEGGILIIVREYFEESSMYKKILMALAVSCACSFCFEHAVVAAAHNPDDLRPKWYLYTNLWGRCCDFKRKVDAAVAAAAANDQSLHASLWSDLTANVRDIFNPDIDFSDKINAPALLYFICNTTVDFPVEDEDVENFMRSSVAGRPPEQFDPRIVQVVRDELLFARGLRKADLALRKWLCYLAPFIEYQLRTCLKSIFVKMARNAARLRTCGITYKGLDPFAPLCVGIDYEGLSRIFVASHPPRSSEDGTNRTSFTMNTKAWQDYLQKLYGEAGVECLSEVKYDHTLRFSGDIVDQAAAVADGDVWYDYLRLLGKLKLPRETPIDYADFFSSAFDRYVGVRYLPMEWKKVGLLCANFAELLEREGYVEFAEVVREITGLMSTFYHGCEVYKHPPAELVGQDDYFWFPENRMLCIVSCMMYGLWKKCWPSCPTQQSDAPHPLVEHLLRVIGSHGVVPDLV
jgi:hypothetical protein